MGTETKVNCYTENTGGATGVLVNGVQKVANSNKLQQQQQLSQNSQQQDNSKQFNYYYTNGQKQQQQTAINGTGSVASKTSLILDQQELNNCKTNTSPLASPTTTTVPFVPYYIDENNVIDGAKEILKVIRPHWDIEQVTFKKFTDGITNKLVGCFYNRSCSPTAEAATTSAASIFNKSNTTTTPPPPPTSNGISQLSIHDDTNDSGNLSDATEDIDIATEDRTDIDADDDGLVDGNEQEQQPAYATNNVVLVRVYGNKTDLLIDRKAETQNIILLHSYGMAPSLYATFKNGLAYDYVPGVTLNDELILRPEVWSLVASRMAEMHRRVVRPGEGAPSSQTIPMLWKKGQQFFDLVPERFTDPEKHKRLERTFLPISRIRAEFTELYNRLVALDSPIVFAHNDLLLGNVVYTESQQAVNFIDYEYADYNFQAFDIGNHFAEFAGVDSVDYSRYPPKAFQMAWLRVYLQSYLQRTDITELELERLYVQVNQFALAAHFFWTIWSIIQAEHSKIDFDYVEYAFMRYNEYLARKDEFLALQIPPRS